MAASMGEARRPLEALRDPGHSACIRLNGERAAETHLWKRLWNEAGMRCCTDGAANHIVERVKKTELMLPEFISGDMDSIEPNHASYFRERNVEIIETPDQEKTDLRKCLELVAERLKAGNHPECRRVVILGGLSGRFDHTLGTLNALLNTMIDFSPNTHVYVIDGKNLMCVLGKGSHVLEMDCRLLSGICGIAPICQEKTVLTTMGFRWNLDGSELSFGGLVSTSNEIAEDTIRCETTAPVIFTCELTNQAVTDEPLVGST